MCPNPPLEAYAEEICTAAKIISAYCVENGLPHPSFDAQAPSVTLPSTAPQNVLLARQTIQAASIKIQQLATEPNEYLPYQAVHYQNLACIHWLCHFRVLSFIPLHGSVPYSEVAIVASVPEAQLKSVARMAMLSNFLREPVPGEVGHSATSALFVTNPGMLDWALYMAEQSAPGAMRLVEATEKWGATLKKNQTAFNIARNTDLPFFDYVAKTPELCKKFSAYMKNVTSSEGMSLKHLVNGFDWAGLGDATVVDVGGSCCATAVALATAFPALKIIVQELPDIVATSAAKLAAEPEAVRARIRTQAHNFFTPQPVRGADVYLLRIILHDWQLAEAVTILRHLVQAMKQRSARSPSPGSSPPRSSPVPGSPAAGSKNGSSSSNGAGNGNLNGNSPKITGSNSAGMKPSRLVIMDAVLPAPGSVPVPEESLLRVRDMTTIQAFNSHEREMDDWERLFDTVSREENASCPPAQAGRLVLKKVAKPFGSVLSVIEVGWVIGSAASAAATASGSCASTAASVAEEKEKSSGPQIKREPGVASPGRLGAGCSSGRNSPARGLGLSMNGRVPGLANGNGIANGNVIANGSGTPNGHGVANGNGITNGNTNGAKKG